MHIRWWHLSDRMCRTHRGSFLFWRCQKNLARR